MPWTRRMRYCVCSPASWATTGLRAKQLQRLCSCRTCSAAHVLGVTFITLADCRLGKYKSPASWATTGNVVTLRLGDFTLSD